MQNLYTFFNRCVIIVVAKKENTYDKQRIKRIY